MRTFNGKTSVVYLGKKKTKEKNIMSAYSKTNVGHENRTELHDALSLTGAEISINNLPAGAGVPFVHAHKENEEIYGVIS